MIRGGNAWAGAPTDLSKTTMISFLRARMRLLLRLLHLSDAAVAQPVMRYFG